MFLEIQLFFFSYVGPPKEDIFPDHLLWSIFQSVSHIYILQIASWTSEGSFRVLHQLLYKQQKLPGVLQFELQQSISTSERLIHHTRDLIHRSPECIHLLNEMIAL